jgi:hypothetical protein
MVPAIAPLTVPSCLACDMPQPDKSAAIAHQAPSFLTHPIITSILLPWIARADSI